MTAQTTALLQKITAFAGKGLALPEPLDPTYIVPHNRTAGDTIEAVAAGEARGILIVDAGTTKTPAQG